MNEYKFSERHACRLLDIERASYRYDARPDRNEKVREALVAEAKQNPRFGYRRLWVVLTKRRGYRVDVKRIHRLYRQEGLAVRRVKRKRVTRPVPSGPGVMAPNQEWAMDFVSDSLDGGRAIRSLTVVDSFTREYPLIEVATGIFEPGRHARTGQGNRTARTPRLAALRQRTRVHQPASARLV